MATKLTRSLLVALSYLCVSVNGKCVKVSMRDGITLSTCIDMPAKPSPPLTALIDRSPYSHFGTEMLADINLLLGNDTAAVKQDMRGTFQSEGLFGLWADSANDTYDTLKYITSQDWSSQRVHTVGASADGLSIFSAAQTYNPWLDSAFLIWAGNDGYGCIYPGGAYNLALTETWLRFTVAKQADVLIHEVKSNEAPGSWWNRLNGTSNYQQVDFPTVMWAGWYDIFLIGNLQGFDAYQHRSPSKGQHYLVVDPLGHCQGGAKYFPRNTVAGRVALPLLLGLELFKPTGSVPENVKRVTFYVMGSHGKNETKIPGNYWTTLDEFPTPTLTPYYLHGDHSLSPVQPTLDHNDDEEQEEDDNEENVDATSLSFTFDPVNPVPSTGGNNLFMSCGPLDQRTVEQRKDVLVFTTSAPLTAPLAITGPLTATLYVSSSAVDTDFTVKLTDVYPSGESSLIQDGVVRLRWRNGPSGGSSPSLVTPGTIYRVSVNLWNTSFIFNSGHRLRVAISSSNYPRYSVNPNNGQALNVTNVAANVTAVNAVYFASNMPSHILLPVIPNYATQMPPAFIQATDPAVDYLQKRRQIEGDEEGDRFEKGFWNTVNRFEEGVADFWASARAQLSSDDEDAGMDFDVNELMV